MHPGKVEALLTDSLIAMEYSIVSFYHISYHPSSDRQVLLGFYATTHSASLNIIVPLSFYEASLGFWMVKTLPVMQETGVRSLSWEDPPGEGNGNPPQMFSNILRAKCSRGDLMSDANDSYRCCTCSGLHKCQASFRFIPSSCKCSGIWNPSRLSSVMAFLWAFGDRQPLYILGRLSPSGLKLSTFQGIIFCRFSLEPDSDE